MPPQSHSSETILEDQAPLVPLDLARRCLFVVGPARSGTTILTDALNHARSIYLLGEPDFHADPGTPGFANRFNTHRAQGGNQTTKGAYCPDFFDGAGTWAQTLDRLSKSYVFVGSKIATRTAATSEQIATILRFHSSHFYDSHYLFSFRQPKAIIVSSYYFQLALGGQASPVEHVIRNFVDTVGLFITMRRTFPNVQVVFHPDVTRETFATIGAAIGVDLSGAGDYYDDAMVSTHPSLALSDKHRRLIDLASGLFDELVRVAAEDFPKLQMEQNNNVMDPARYTRLGRLTQQADFIGRALAAKHDAVD